MIASNSFGISFGLASDYDKLEQFLKDMNLIADLADPAKFVEAFKVKYIKCFPPSGDSGA